MEFVITQYGRTEGAKHIRYYNNGNIREFILNKVNEIKTLYGKVIPQYEENEFRRKHVKPVIFHANGVVKNLPLQEVTEIKTAAGVFSAELITFYEDGAIHRIFPQDGKLTGFWSEEDEYELAPTFEFKFPFGKLEKKVIAIRFYPDGAVKGVTLWPKDTVTFTSPVGLAEARIGISFYPDGQLRSFEPNKPIGVTTPIGQFKAYDRTAIGIHGDSNSLRFTPRGEIEQVVTATEMVKVTDKSGTEHLFKPEFRHSLFNLGVMELIPLSIGFDGNKVQFNKMPDHEFDLAECKFVVTPAILKNPSACVSCHDCSACQ